MSTPMLSQRRYEEKSPNTAASSALSVPVPPGVSAGAALSLRCTTASEEEEEVLGLGELDCRGLTSGEWLSAGRAGEACSSVDAVSKAMRRQLILSTESVELAKTPTYFCLSTEQLVVRGASDANHESEDSEDNDDVQSCGVGEAGEEQQCRMSDAPDGRADFSSDDDDEDGFFHETVLLGNATFLSLGSTGKTSTLRGEMNSLSPGSAASPPPRLQTQDPETSTPLGYGTREEEEEDNGGRGGATVLSFLTPHGSDTNTAAPHISASDSGDYRTSLTDMAALPSFSLRRQLMEDSQEAAEAMNVGDEVAEEYLFIDNHDGTAYLSDASRLLDGSYLLGETILLAQTMRGSHQSHNWKSCGGSNTTQHHLRMAASPVPVPQAEEDLPRQRPGQEECRPPRGTAAKPSSGLVSPAPSIARVIVRRSAAPARDASLLPLADRSTTSLHRSFCFDHTVLVACDDASWVWGSGGSASAPDGHASIGGSPMVKGRGVAASPSICRASPLPHPPPPLQGYSNDGSGLVLQAAPPPALQGPRRSDSPAAAAEMIYLVPSDAAIFSPEDITSQGWVPVQMVGRREAAMPRGAHHPAPRSGAGGWAPVRVRSPLPIDPAAATRAGEGDGDAGEVVEREGSVSRSANLGESHSRIAALSASTISCINRRLSFSLSQWGSSRRQQHGSQGSHDTGVDGLPPATPLAISVVQLEQSGDVRLTFDAAVPDGASRYSCSPLPVPPEGSPPPQREGSPSRCPASAFAMSHTTGTAAMAAAEDSSLLTSMSYQRPSAATIESTSFWMDTSMSLPLTSSASASMQATRQPHHKPQLQHPFHQPNQYHQQQQKQQLRRQNQSALSLGASTLSLPTASDQSQQIPLGSSFRTTFCGRAPGTTAAVAATTSAASAGLPVSRGQLGSSRHGAQHHLPSQSGHVDSHGATDANGRVTVVSRRLRGRRPASAEAGAATLASAALRRQKGQPRPSSGGIGGKRVPDTSVFLPWAPLTITPESSVNVVRNEDTRSGWERLMAGGFGHPMRLRPFTASSSEDMIHPTTAASSTNEAASMSEMVRPVVELQRGSTDGDLSPEALRAFNAAMAAISSSEADGTVSRDAFMSSFLQHAASQAPSSASCSLMQGVKSYAMSRSAALSQVLRSSDDTGLEATTMMVFQGESLAATEGEEPEPALPLVRQRTAVAADDRAPSPDCKRPVAGAENIATAAVRSAPSAGSLQRSASSQQKSPSLGVVRQLSLRQRSSSNIAAPSLKETELRESTAPPMHHIKDAALV